MELCGQLEWRSSWVKGFYILEISHTHGSVIPWNTLNFMVMLCLILIIFTLIIFSSSVKKILLKGSGWCPIIRTWLLVWLVIVYWLLWSGWVRVSGSSNDINTGLITVLVTHSLDNDDTPPQCPTIVVFIIHIQTEPLTQLHKLLPKILMGLLMIMFTFISCSLNIIPSDCNGAFYEVNFKRSAWPDYPSMTRSRHRLMSCVLIL